MATITLAGNTVNGCLGIGSYSNVGTAFSSAKKNTGSLTQSLKSLKNKVSVAASAADVSSAMHNTQNSISREEQKQSSISLVNDKLDNLISDAGTVDNQAATEVERQKKDFYKKYGYLKPESEKSWTEKVGDKFKGLWDGLCAIDQAIRNFVKDAVEWVKEHWDAVLAVVIAIVAVVVAVLTFGVGAVLIAAAIGLAWGLAKQLATDLVVFAVTGKWETSWRNYLISGLESSLGAIFTLSGHPILGATLSSLLKDGLEETMGVKDHSGLEIAFNAGFAAGTAFLFKKIFDSPSLKTKVNTSLNKTLSKIPFLSRFSGQGSFSASFKTVMTKLFGGQIKNISFKTVRNGLMHIITEDIFSGVWSGAEKIIIQKIEGLFNFEFPISPTKPLDFTYRLLNI